VKRQLTILGGGLAGLSAGYYAKQADFPLIVLEAGSEVGGNGRTLDFNGFYMDTGAHRFHDKQPDITSDIKRIMGEDLKLVKAPSQIYIRGGFVDFPLSPYNLFKHLGPVKMLRGGLDLLRSKRIKPKAPDNFEAYAISKYGKSLAEEFLLNYTEKLWGKHPSELSTDVSGKRLKGLGLYTFLLEWLMGEKAKTRHLDGAFFYPKKGYGAIAKRLAEGIGKGNIRTGSRVTEIRHNGGAIVELTLNNSETLAPENVLNTLPLSLLVGLLSPKPPKSVIEAASQLEFRNLILVFITINTESISKNATTYFPDPALLFTRISEPKNRSPFMAPEGKTSLLIEVPCFSDDELWTMEESGLSQKVVEQVVSLKLFDKTLIENCHVVRMPYAYPVLDVNYKARVKLIIDYISNFENLYNMGRGGLFSYSHLHDLMKDGKELVNKL